MFGFRTTNNKVSSLKITMRTETKQTLSSLFHSIYYHGNDVIFYRMNDFYKMNGAYRIF